MENALLRFLIANFTMITMEVVIYAMIPNKLYQKVDLIALFRSLIVPNMTIMVTAQNVIKTSSFQILGARVKNNYPIV